MSRVKTFAKYAIWLILFWIFSDILIHVGMNSIYKDMESKSKIPEGIEIVQMQSTKVNGIIKLKVNDVELSGKYIKVDLYSKFGNLFGTQYLQVGNIKENESKEIETFFKISDVKSYEISVVEEKGENSEGFMDTAMSAISVIILVIKMLFI